MIGEIYLYQGVAMFSESPPSCPIYILLARRNHFAWKVNLCFVATNRPGISEELNVTEDNIQAGKIFSRLRFL